MATQGGGTVVDVNSTDYSEINLSSSSVNRGITYTVDGSGNVTAIAGADSTKQDFIDASNAAAVRTALNVEDGADVTPSWVPASDPAYVNALGAQVALGMSETTPGTLNYVDSAGTAQTFTALSSVARVNDITNVSVSSPAAQEVLGITSVDGNGIPQWSNITVSGQPHPHPEQLTISASQTEFIENSTSTETVSIVVTELGAGADLDSMVLSSSNPNVTFTQATGVTGPSATGLASINAAVKFNAGTFTISATVSGSGGGQTYSNQVRTVQMHVAPVWYANVLDTEPTTLPGASQGVFRVGDSVQLTGIADGTIYVWVPTTSVSTVRFTTANPNIGLEATEVGRTLNGFSLLSLGALSVAGRTLTVRIGEI